MVTVGDGILRVYDSYTNSEAHLCLENASDNPFPLERAFHWQKLRARAWEKKKGRREGRRETEDGGEWKIEKEGERKVGGREGEVIEQPQLTHTPGQNLTKFSTKVPLPSEESDKDPQESSL